MKLKNYILLLPFLLSIKPAFSQYAEDALRFSQTEQGTTARFRAMGGAQTALGGDVSSLGGNPAGLGMFTRSELNITADYGNTKSDATYINSSTNADLSKLGLSQVGGVWHSTVNKRRGAALDKGWLSVNFGISYNKTNNFNRDIDYQGTNPRSSFADYLADLATTNYLADGDVRQNRNVLPSGTLEDMAYSNYLIEYNPSGYFATTDLNNTQRNLDRRTGSQSEVNFGIGANYSNSLYVGASLGLTSLNYTSDRQFLESGRVRSYEGQGTEFVGSRYDLGYQSYQNTTGSGVNLKLGLIYRPTSNVRVGVNFITPTWYSINDSFSETLDTRYSTINTPYTNPETVYESTYTLRTPYRLNGGLSVTFANSGLLTGDVEYVDYSSTKITMDDQTAEINTNRDIRNNFVSAVNFRVGGEYKLTNSVSLRAGYTTNGNPYKDMSYSLSNISGGLGYRVNNFYIDATYVNTTEKYSSRPYLISSNFPDYPDTGAGESASIKGIRNRVFLTVGTRF